MSKLKALRIKNNYSCEYVASQIGISKPFYWQLENGTRRMTYEIAIKIAKFFNTTPDYLFYDDFKEKLKI